MKTRKSKLENPETRRSIIKSAGILIGSIAISLDPEFGNRFLEEFQDRLYWGTDHAKLPFVSYFRKLKEQHLISDAAYEKITWKNASRLLLE